MLHDVLFLLRDPLYDIAVAVALAAWLFATLVIAGCR